MRKAFLSILAMAVIAMPAAAQARRTAVAADVSDRPKLDVESYAVQITLVPEEHRLQGVADVKFRQLDRQSYATFDFDRRLRVSDVKIGAMPVRFRQFDLDSTLEVDLGGLQFTDAPTVHVEYSGILDPDPDRREPVLGRVSDDSAFLLYDGKWFPSNGQYKDKATMRLRVNAPAGWTVVSDLPAGPNGEFVSQTPSYWGMVAAGKYTVTGVNSARSEITIDTLKAQSDAVTPLADTAGKVLDYYTETFGPAPSPRFRIIEVQGANWASRWSVGTLLLSSAQFRPDFDVPALAQAIAHQWFPLKVAVADPAHDAWLVDGMSVFASLMYFEKSLSPADAQDQIDKALVKALGYEGNISIKQAGELEKESQEYHSLVEYKGGYVLRMLRWVVGDDKFNDLLVKYLERFQNTPASTEAFTKMASDLAGEDLTYFFDQWLNSSGVPEMKTEYTVYRVPTGFKIEGQISQDLDLFKMPVELQILTDDEPDYKRVEVSGPSSDFDVLTDRKPKAVVIDPRKKILRMSPDIRVSVYINRGEESAADGRYNDAIDEYQKAIDLSGSNSLALFRMGEALFELGNLQAAAGDFREAYSGDLKPKWVEVWAHINLGKIYDIRSQRDRAIIEYQKAVNTGDDSFGAQAEAQKYINAPFRQQSGKTSIGD